MNATCNQCGGFFRYVGAAGTVVPVHECEGCGRQIPATTQPDGFSFVVLGRPVGKGRPRFGQGRTWTPRTTTVAEEAVRAGWESAGAVRLDGPVVLHLLLAIVRPRDHYTSKGALSAKGRRSPFPHRQKPDVDNALKLVCDALNTRAWRDDVQVVRAKVDRCWDDRSYTRVIARALDEPMELAA